MKGLSGRSCSPLEMCNAFENISRYDLGATPFLRSVPNSGSVVIGMLASGVRLRQVLCAPL